MAEVPSTTLKKRLIATCLNQVALNIESAKQLLKNIVESKLNDTKSSAGDKFETSRERLQAEEDRINAVLINSKQLEHKLKTLNTAACNKVQAGAIIQTNMANYFISIGLGKIVVDDATYYIISPEAPLSKIMWQKQIGETFNINNSIQTITDIN